MVCDVAENCSVLKRRRIDSAIPTERTSVESESPAIEFTGTLQRLASRPRLWVCDHFLTATECEVICAAVDRGAHGEGSAKPLLRPEEQTILDNIGHRIGALVGTPTHAAETPLAARRTPPSLPNSGILPLGLHVDVFQGSQRRFVTGLVYLSDGVEGGETAFPFAVPAEGAAAVEDVIVGPVEVNEHSAALADAQLLLDSGYLHTGAATTTTLDGDGGYVEPLENIAAAAWRLAAWAEGTPEGTSNCAGRRPPGILVRPRMGRLLLFFTRMEDGRIDPHSFHGGRAVRPNGSMKITAQAFKEVPSVGIGMGSAPNMPCSGDSAENKDCLATELADYIAPRLANLLQ